ncbi:MAG: molybdopterin molybdotransferase MoeA [Desulfurococcaceae archaeon]|jgi:molybdopterin molybdotransferase|nr:molybdopterin molybdotransferase MoeA [Desulfurococcaceae archaeon]
MSRLELISYEEALRRLLEEVNVEIASEVVDLTSSVGRYSYRDYVSKVDVPPFNRSAVDGFAASFADIVGASEGSPVLLKVIGSVDVDSNEVPAIRRSEAVRVSTGAPIPTGADVVIPIEYCRVVGDRVYVYRSYPRYANISFKGEDLRAGDIVVRRGTRLRPWHVAALKASGYEEVEVFRDVRVSVVSTGSELVKGVIPNYTLPLVVSYIVELGGEVALTYVVPDSVGDIATAVERSLGISDVVIVTGGTSVGDRDLSSRALESLGRGRRVFHGVRVRPGRTCGAYVIDGKPVLLVSGLPVAAYISLELFLRPLIYKLFNGIPEPKPTVRGRLTRRLPNEPGFRSFYRAVACIEGGEVLIVPLRLTGSGILSTLIRGNAVVEVPEDSEGYEEGSEIIATLVNPLVDCSSIKPFTTVPHANTNSQAYK